MFLCVSGPSSWADSELRAVKQGGTTDAIAVLERETGVTSTQLVDPLLGLADALIAAQRPEAATEPLRRAINIIRRSAGLYDLQQYPLLLRAVDLQSQVGDFEAAAADLAYMQRISEVSYASKALEHGRSLAEVASWQCRMGQFFVARATHRRSIAVLETQPSKEVLVAALRGLARCSLYALSAQGVATGSDSFGTYRGPIIRSQHFSPSNPAFRSHVFRSLRIEGEEALQRAVQLSETLDPTLHLQVLLDAGDWFLIKDYVREARRLYAKAETVARTGGVRDVLMAPEQVLYAMPAAALRNRHLAAADSDEDFVEVEFTVRGDGRVINERIIERGAGRSAVMETLGSLRAARFRPRMVGGKTQATDGVRFRQSYRQLK